MTFLHNFIFPISLYNIFFKKFLRCFKWRHNLKKSESFGNIIDLSCICETLGSIPGIIIRKLN